MLFHEVHRIRDVASTLARRLGGRARSAAILGSGFGVLRDLLEDAIEVPFEEVGCLESCNAPGHAGTIAAGSIAGVRHVFFVGRHHLYEGRGAGSIAVPVALASALGADRILLTCAAGATSEAVAPGSLVLIEDHLNLTGENPLLSVPARKRRPAFLPMGDAYDRRALETAERIAAARGESIRRGVLAALTGPSFETPAEYRALARLGADVVSMSCVLETIAARALAMKVLAIAAVANGPARLGGGGADGDEVLTVVAAAVRGRLGYLAEVLTGFAGL